MFSFLMDIGNYEQRCVGRYPEEGNFLVDTAYVSDGDHPYETAVQHPEYNRGKVVIVECYASKSLALEGHFRWVETMTAKELPDKLVDCLNSGLSKLAISGANVFPRVKQIKE